MKSIEITTTTTLEFDLLFIGLTDCTVEISATVYPSEDGEPQRVELDGLDFPNDEKGSFIFRSQAEIPRRIGTANYDRCLLAVQNEIESQLNSKAI